MCVCVCVFREGSGSVCADGCVLVLQSGSAGVCRPGFSEDVYTALMPERVLPGRPLITGTDPDPLTHNIVCMLSASQNCQREHNVDKNENYSF